MKLKKGIRVGTDIIEIERIRNAAKRHPGFFDRILTADEKKYCLAKVDSCVPLAGRFAAKEAVMKCLQVGLERISWQDIAILADEVGSPQVHLTGAARQLLRESGLGYIQVSISHSRDYAMAVAIGECVADADNDRG